MKNAIDDDEILFKSEGSSIPFRSDEYWNEVKVADFKNNLKQIAKLKRVLYEICKRQLIVYKPIELNH